MVPRSLYISIGGDRNSAISESWTDFDAVKSIWIDFYNYYGTRKKPS